jgi:hypothetical protein
MLVRKASHSGISDGPPSLPFAHCFRTSRIDRQMTETDKTNLAADEQPYDNKVFPLRMASLSLTSVTLAQSATASSWLACAAHVGQ